MSQPMTLRDVYTIACGKDLRLIEVFLGNETTGEFESQGFVQVTEFYGVEGFEVPETLIAGDFQLIDAARIHTSKEGMFVVDFTATVQIGDKGQVYVVTNDDETLHIYFYRSIFPLDAAFAIE